MTILNLIIWQKVLKKGRKHCAERLYPSGVMLQTKTLCQNVQRAISLNMVLRVEHLWVSLNSIVSVLWELFGQRSKARI